MRAVGGALPHPRGHRQAGGRLLLNLVIFWMVDDRIHNRIRRTCDPCNEKKSSFFRILAWIQTSK